MDLGFSLTQASPWLQLPIVLLAALPAAGLGAAAMVRAVDWAAAVLGDDNPRDVD